jgi:hypothetical protein
LGWVIPILRRIQPTRPHHDFGEGIVKYLHHMMQGRADADALKEPDITSAALMATGKTMDVIAKESE